MSHICYDLKTYIKLMLILIDKPTMKNVCRGQDQIFGFCPARVGWLGMFVVLPREGGALLFCLFHQHGEEGSDGESFAAS